MSSNSPIAVLGAGSWGSALAIVLAKNNQTVYLWDHDTSLMDNIIQTGENTRYLPNIPFPKNIKPFRDLKEALAGVQDILLVVPSHAFRSACQGILPFLTKENRIAWATKGLDPAGIFLHEVAEQELGKHHFAVLSGPSFAKEVAKGLPTAVTIAATDVEFMQSLVGRFQKEPFLVYPSNDLIGVQLAGVLKNVLAVAVGISDGVHFGANARAALITRGLAEMMSFGEALGAKRETFMGLAGCGDVILTCTDDQSRNRRFGLALAKGLSETEALKEIGQVVEAVYNVEQLCRLSQKFGIELPIAEQVFRVMKEGISPSEAVSTLFRRNSKSE